MMLRHSLIASLFLACLLLGATGCGGPGVLAPRKYTVISTGFMRGQIDDFDRRMGMGHHRARFFGGAARTDTLLGLLRRRSESSGRRILLTDLGDFLSGSAEAEVTRGGSSLAVMAGRDYDAILLGNREFNYGQEVLTKFQQSRSRGKRLPLVTSNLFLKHGGASIGSVGGARSPSFAASSRIPTPEFTGEGIRILGFSPGNLSELVEPKDLEGIQVESDLTRVLATSFPSDRPSKPEFTILLCQIDVVTHREELARALAGSEVDLVIGHAYGRGATAFREGNCWFVGVRNDLPGAAVGKWDIDVDPATGKILTLHEDFFVALGRAPGRDFMRKEEGFHPGAHPSLAEPLPPDKKLLDSLSPFKEQLALLDEVLTQAEADFTGSYENESTLGNLVADALLAADPEADIAMISAGVVDHHHLSEGPVRRKDLSEMFPYKNQLLKIQLPGKKIRQGLSRLISKQMHMLVSGMSFSWRDGTETQIEPGIQIAGAPLEDDRIYTLLLNSFAHRRDPIFREFQGEEIGDCRELIEAYLKSQEKIIPLMDGRRKRLLPE